MVKPFKVLALGLTSGLLVFLTSRLGLTGTVIGSVISSIVYNVIQGYIDENKIGHHGNIKLTREHLDSDLFYILPIAVILFILVIYLFSFSVSGETVFSSLEGATNNNLFKFMGIGLIVMGIFPIFQSKTFKRINGILLIFSGLTLLLWGFLDEFKFSFGNMVDTFVSMYFPLAFIICLILIYVILTILYNGLKENYNNKNKPTDNDFKINNNHSNVRVNKPHMNSNVHMKSSNINSSNLRDDYIKNNNHGHNNINKKVFNRLKNRHEVKSDKINHQNDSTKDNSEMTINTSKNGFKYYSNKKH